MRAAALALLVAGCASVPSGRAPLSVSQAIQRLDDLGGSYVKVEGVSGGCDLGGCSIVSFDGSDRMSVLGDEKFILDMRRYVGRSMLIQGRIDASCIRGSSPKPPTAGMMACMGVGTPFLDGRLIAVR